MKSKIKKPVNISKKIIILIFIIIVAFITAGIWYTLSVRTDNTPSTTAHNSQQSSNTGDITQGGAIDNNGKATTDSQKDQWNISDSGAITLKTPASSATLQNGNEISGSATIDAIHYRLVDNAAGVIAQGSLNVVNDNYSGNLQFTSRGSNGTLVIYSFDNQGREINRIAIPVVLKS
jgi:cell division protein FtsI/penicillin-binding protein 2